MKAIGLKHYLPIEDPSSFLDVELPKPQPTGRDLLIAVKAIAVNPVDTKVRRGRSDDTGKAEDPPRVIGWDASGVVEAVGEGVTLFKPGDEVWYAGEVFPHPDNSNSWVLNPWIFPRNDPRLYLDERDDISRLGSAQRAIGIA